jgi:hypothetical protein
MIQGEAHLIDVDIDGGKRPQLNSRDVLNQGARVAK